MERWRVRIPAEAAGEFSAPETNFVCRLLFGVRSTHVLPQRHVKVPGHSAKSAGGRLHLSTPTPLTQRSWDGLTVPMSGHTLRTYPETSSRATCQGTRPQSCQFAEPLLSNPGLKSRSSVCELISTLRENKKKKRWRGSDWSNISRNPRQRGKSRHHHHHHFLFV